jgi:outer membrane lipase/esterase
VWGGANDLFAVTAGANPTTTIGAAVTDQIGLVGQLQAGARYVLVPNLPDVGLTPSFRGRGAVARHRTVGRLQQGLYGGLKQAGIEFIPLDTFTCCGSRRQPGPTASPTSPAPPARYPITANSLTCNPTSYVSPDAATPTVRRWRAPDHGRPPCWASTRSRCWKARACSRC